MTKHERKVFIKTDSEIPLKPCPECHSEAWRILKTPRWTQISCRLLPNCNFSQVSFGKTFKEAVEKWNTIIKEREHEKEKR